MENTKESVKRAVSSSDFQTKNDGNAAVEDLFVSMAMAMVSLARIQRFRRKPVTYTLSSCTFVMPFEIFSCRLR